jgi:hypothetical protein
MRAACLAIAASTSAGCGAKSATTTARGEERPSAPRLSARFSTRTVYWFEGERSTSVTRGAFDWASRRGFAVERGFGATRGLIQIGDTCYSRSGKEPWRISRATDPHGLCSAADFANPSTTDDLMQVVAGDWRKVGRVPVRGVATTHYRGELNIGAVRGPIELWVDDEGVVRRERQAGDEAESYVTVRDYYDFGVAVRVRRPTTGRTR